MTSSPSSSGRTSWNINSSITAKRTNNPIRAIVDQMKITPNPSKDMIALSIGDPTVFGNLAAPSNAIEAVCNKVKAAKHNGYPTSTGYMDTREAIAKYASKPNAELKAEDVIVASGCSGALDLAIGVLVNEGQNILIPCPGFSLYQTLAESKGATVRSYKLLPDKQWEIDIAHMESLIDSSTAAIVVNNPSNPCGSNYTVEHIKDILAVAERHFLPIIADEIYADMVFKGSTFTPMASLSTNVPILSVGGIAKRFIVPGWRLGWICIHDRNGAFEAEIRGGLVKLTQLILGANSLVQSVLPELLHETPQRYYTDTMATLEEHARLIYDRLLVTPGLTPIMPGGTMYIMVGVDMSLFPDFKDDMDFVQRLISDQSVFCLPGRCFQYPNYFRIVISPPKDKLIEACNRISEFCKAHVSM